MLTALGRAFDQLGDPAVGRILWLSAAMAAAVLLALIVLIAWALAAIDFNFAAWGPFGSLLDALIDVAGTLAAVFVALVLFPGFASLISSLSLDEVADRVDRAWYPGLAPARPQGVLAGLGLSLRFLGVMVVLNVAALIIVYLFVPFINVLVFYLLNGYLLGREYFELVARRRLSAADSADLRGRYPTRLLVAGTILAGLLTVPFLNLLVPVIATAFMNHVFHQMLGERSSETA